MNLKEVGGDWKDIGTVLFPAAYGVDKIWEYGKTAIAGHPEQVAVNVAWLATLIGLGTVGSWVGGYLDGLRGRK